MKSGESLILWDFSLIIHMKAFLKFTKYQKVKRGTHAKHELWSQESSQESSPWPKNLCVIFQTWPKTVFTWQASQQTTALPTSGFRRGLPSRTPAPWWPHVYNLLFSVSLGQKLPFGCFLAWVLFRALLKILFCPLTQYLVLLHPWPFLLRFPGTQDRPTDSSLAGDTAAELAWGVRLDLIQEFPTSWRAWPNLER